MNILKKEFASESGHWYAKDGTPAYTIKAKNGEDRATTLRDARKLGLVPSVTTILNVAAKPALEQWKLRQTVMAALTLPQMKDEPLDAFAVRVISDSKEHARKRAEEGSAIHGSIELALEGKKYDPVHEPFVFAVMEKLKNFGSNWGVERSFAHPLGYGGKVDLHNENYVIDFKTKEFSKEDEKLSWPEQAMQLAAYRNGLGLSNARCMNMFISVNNPGLVAQHEWEPGELETALKKFLLLHSYWMLDKGLTPAPAPPGEVTPSEESISNL